MIAYLSGHLIAKSFPHATLLLKSGIGYEVIVTEKMLEYLSLGQETELFIKEIQKQEETKLYAFLSSEQRAIFVILIGIEKVGPQLAHNIVDTFSPAELLSIFSHKKTHELNSIKGVGEKTAKRILLEMETTMKKFRAIADLAGNDKASDNLASCIQESKLALLSLGVNRLEAEDLIQKALAELPQPSSQEELLRLVFQLRAQHLKNS